MLKLRRMKALTPLLLGLCIGVSFSFFSLIPVSLEPLSSCILIPTVLNPHVDLKINKPRQNVETNIDVLLNTTASTTVKPKTSRFNYDYRPYFIYSELSYRSQLIIGVITTEKRLQTYGFSINNTWLNSFNRVLFFTAYSKDFGFHERFNRKLNLNVIQLPDVDEENSNEVEMTTRVLRYMKDHFHDNYNWFMIVKDNTYINSDHLLTYLGGLDKSKDLYVGAPRKFNKLLLDFDAQSHNVLHDKSDHLLCQLNYGIIFSRSALFKLINQMDTCLKSGKRVSVDEVVGYCSIKAIGNSCHGPSQASALYYQSLPTISNALSNKMQSAMVIASINSPDHLVQLHHLLALQRLDNIVTAISEHQTSIKDMTPSIPRGVPEKILHWPVGFSPPFKPQSRFEVIQWSYFTDKQIFGHTMVEPMSLLSKSDRKDIHEVMQSSISMLKNEYKTNHKLKFNLLDGYRRIDPQRGTEYVMDINVKEPDGSLHVRRVHLLRPLTKVETLHMPAATEQRGIHLVLPVLREDTARFEEFLQMYKRVCLQTGENVVLLTVFVNIKSDGVDASQNDDTFRLSKNLIARYKQSYMWAQLPWLQIGVKQSAVTLIMDIVSMKLPSNALIFVVSLGVEFTINFLNRCRVNVVNGAQAYFPIPFSEFNPDIIFKQSQRPTFLDVHRDHGVWDRSSTDLGCFSNKDYKDLRMQEDDFLSENRSSNLTLLSVFKASNLHVFRGLDQELHRKFHPLVCHQKQGTDNYRQCMQDAGEKMASRSQIARFLFDKTINYTSNAT